MPSVRFTGWVLPKVHVVSAGPLESVNWVDEELDLEMTFSITIRNSFIEIVCGLNRYDPALTSELYKRALDLSRAAIDLVSFSSGQGMTVMLDRFTDPDGRNTAVAFTYPELARHCTAFRADADFGGMCKLVMAEPNLFMALNDLIAAITYPHLATVNCARVVEAIRNCIAPPSDPPPKAGKELERERKERWATMRSCLRLGEAFLMPITDVSKKPRHGDKTYIPGPQVGDVVQRTWAVMNRFLEYRKRGSLALPETEFPLLGGP